MTIGESLDVIRERLVILPARLQCETCGYFNVDDPEAVAIIREAGQRVAAAACKCPDREAQVAREAGERWMLSNLPHRGPKSTPRTLATFQRREGTAADIAAAEAMIAIEGPHTLVLNGEWGCVACCSS